MRTTALGALFIAVAACSPTPPKTAAGPEQTVVPAPLEAVWWAVVDVVGEYDLPLESMDLGRGYIRTGRAVIPADDEYWQCADSEGGGGSYGDEEVGAAISITVVPVNAGSTQLRVTADPTTSSGRLCTSLGSFEERIGERIYERWQELNQ